VYKGSRCSPFDFLLVYIMKFLIKLFLQTGGASFVILLFLFSPVASFAIEHESALLESDIILEDVQEVYKGRILKQNEIDCGLMTESVEFECFNYEVEILEGEYEGEKVETMPTWVSNQDDLFKEGSKVYISQTEYFTGEEVWSVESYSRESALLILTLIFVVLIVLITGTRGLTATFGLIVSFLTLYFFAIPNINAGSSLLFISFITIFILLCASTFITYGFNIKSVIAFTATFLGIIIIAGIGYLVISWLNISGTGEEASNMLFDTTQGVVRLSWIFLLSIVIGALGVLDDVTIGQASSMIEIYETDKSLTSSELFRKTMNIGKDHIASMVNTLFIAYAGSSFSLIMLLSANNPDLRILINEGFVVEEIVRTLVASIGLILIVPLTSLLSSRIIVKVLKDR
jgi:uncharacterized membrane protein